MTASSERSEPADQTRNPNSGATAATPPLAQADPTSPFAQVPVPDDLPELLVITPWYPNDTNAYAGTFVREAVRAVGKHYDDLLIIHAEIVPLEDTRQPRWSDTAEGRLLWIPVPMDPLTGRGQMMLEQRKALAEHALPYLQHAPLIHCHVGAPTGAAIVPLIAPTARLVVTEHATYLAKVLRDPLGRELYEAAIRRADVFSTVSNQTAWLIKGTFPDAIEEVAIIANPVQLRSLPLKHDQSAHLSRWLYVGNLVAHKGVHRLVRSFAAWVNYTRDAQARLTIVGDGPLREELAALGAELGVADRIEFRGRVEPDEIGKVYVEHDVLVHLSHIETFGLTCVEAAACGLPVIVTECGAPTDTLVVHFALGLAQFVPLGDAQEREDVEPVIEALARLQRSIDPDNARMSRRHLQRAYGADTIGAQLHAALSGESAPAQPIYDGLRVLAVALNAKQARNAEATLANFASFGGGGVYLTAAPPRRMLPGSVQVVDISGVEKAALTYKVERLLVLRAPGLALRALGKVARGVGAVAPSVGDPATRTVARAQQVHRRAALALRNRGPYARFWRNIGPWYTARRLEAAGTLQAMDMDNFDCVVLSDVYLTPIVVRAVRLNGDLDVRTRWTRQAIARLYAERVLATGVGGFDDDVSSEQGSADAAPVGAADADADVAASDNIRS